MPCILLAGSAIHSGGRVGAAALGIEHGGSGEQAGHHGRDRGLGNASANSATGVVKGETIQREGFVGVVRDLRPPEQGAGVAVELEADVARGPRRPRGVARAQSGNVDVVAR